MTLVVGWANPTLPTATKMYPFAAVGGYPTYEIVILAADGTGWVSSLNDVTTWDALDLTANFQKVNGIQQAAGVWLVWGQDLSGNACVAGYTALNLTDNPTSTPDHGLHSGAAGEFVNFTYNTDNSMIGLVTNEPTPTLHWSLNEGTTWSSLVGAGTINIEAFVSLGTVFIGSESGATALYQWDVSGTPAFSTIPMTDVGPYLGFMTGVHNESAVATLMLGQGNFASLSQPPGSDTTVTNPIAPKIPSHIANSQAAGGSNTPPYATDHYVATSYFDQDVLLYSDDDGATWTNATAPTFLFSDGIVYDNSGFWAFGDGLLYSQDGLNEWIRLNITALGAPAAYDVIAGAAQIDTRSVIFAFSKPGQQLSVLIHSPGEDDTLAGTIAGVSGLTGSLFTEVRLTGTVAGVSAIAGTLTGSNHMTGVIAGTSVLSGSISAQLLLTGSIDGVTALVAAAIVSSVAKELLPTIGIIEAFTEAVGSSDNEVGGISVTRMTSAGALGDMTIQVETTFEWPLTGKFSIDGVVYSYIGKTLTAFTGISHIAGGEEVAGLKRNHSKQSAVLDLSRTRSALDKVRRAMLVEYSEGEDLNVIGRNLGVLRPPSLGDDDRFREIVKAIAYNPRGTIYGLELALKGIVGEGNFAIFEDLITFPNKVFISLLNDALTSTRSAGKMYLSQSRFMEAVGGDTISLGADILKVQGATLRDEDLVTPTTLARPTAQTIVPFEGSSAIAAWQYAGAVAEATATTLGTTGDGLGYLRIQVTTSASVLYKRFARVQPESYAVFALLLRVPSGVTLNTDANQFTIDLWDGAHKLRVGFTNAGAGTFTVGFANDSNTLINGVAAVLARDLFHDIAIEKRGDFVYLSVNEHIVQSAKVTDFVASALAPRAQYGAYPNGSGTVAAAFDVKESRLWTHTHTDYWPRRGANGSVQTGEDKFDAGTPGQFTLADIGKQLIISGSTVANPNGGYNNSRWLISGIVTDQVVELVGHPHKKLSTNIAHPTRVITDEFLFKYPDDLGRKVTISGSTLGNNGTYVISTLRDSISLVDFATLKTKNPEVTNVAELTGATFQTETDLEWKLTPNPTFETVLHWEMSDAGSFDHSTFVAVLPAILPYAATSGFPLVVELLATKVLSAQLLENEDVHNAVIATLPKVLYEYYPIYLADPLGIVRAFLDELTVAGVIPEYKLT